MFSFSLENQVKIHLREFSDSFQLSPSSVWLTAYDEWQYEDVKCSLNMDELDAEYEDDDEKMMEDD